MVIFLILMIASFGYENKFLNKVENGFNICNRQPLILLTECTGIVNFLQFYFRLYPVYQSEKASYFSLLSSNHL